MFVVKCRTQIGIKGLLRNRVRIVDEQEQQIFIGNVHKQTTQFLDPETVVTYELDDYTRHLYRKPIKNFYSGLLGFVIQELLQDGGAYDFVSPVCYHQGTEEIKVSLNVIPEEIPTSSTSKITLQYPATALHLLSKKENLVWTVNPATGKLHIFRQNQPSPIPQLKSLLPTTGNLLIYIPNASSSDWINKNQEVTLVSDFSLSKMTKEEIEKRIFGRSPQMM